MTTRPVPPGELTSELRERVRQQSKLAFGNLDRLDVAVAVAMSDDGVVNATDVGRQLDLAVNRVRTQLLTFVQLGVLQRLPREGGKLYYLRVDSGFWRVCLDFYQHALATSRRVTGLPDGHRLG